jgi:leader peptidase (prepilin peptidase)/N-methyltransferase
MASVLGAAVGILMKVRGSLREGPLRALRPFLAGGGVAVLLIGLGPVLEWMGWA